MANANLKSLAQYPERRVTIQQSVRYRKNIYPITGPYKAPPLYPWLKLSGRWLEIAGFEPGQRVKIQVQYGKLTITMD